MTLRLRAVLWPPLRSIRRGTAWWAIAIAGLIAATVAFWPAFKGASGITQAIDSLPPAVIDAFGLTDFGSPAGFLRGNLYELFVPLLLSIAAVAMMNGQTAADESAGRLELTLSQPVGRRAVFAARAMACVIAIAAMVVVTIVIQLLADAALGLSEPADRIVATAILCGLLAVLHGSVAYLVACLAARPSAVLGAGVALTIGGYVVAALFPISDALKPWRVVSPWSWALGSDPLVNGAEPWRFVLLAGVSLALLVVGTMVVVRRDVAAA